MLRLKPLIYYAVVAAVFILAALALYTNQSAELTRSRDDLSEGRAMLLAPGMSADTLARLLADNYMADKRDARLAANHIARLIELQGSSPANLGWLNRPAARLTADTMLRFGGRRMQTRVRSSQQTLGITPEVLRMYDSDNASTQFGTEGKTISVKVRTAPRPTDKTTQPLPGVLVRLTEHRYVQQADGPDDTPHPQAVDSILGYALTDADGVAHFRVPAGGYYSVLPVQPGYEFGNSKGTTSGALESDQTFSFRQRRQALPVFDSSTYRRIKQDHALLVRSPQSYRKHFMLGAVMFLLTWGVAFAVLGLIDRRLKRNSDMLIAAAAMLLTAIMWIAMHSIPNPLLDMPNGWTMTKGLVLGVAAMVAVSSINFVKLHLGTSRMQFGVMRFDFVSQALGLLLRPLASLAARPAAWCTRRNIQYPAGLGYLMLALLLMLMLALFGSGPEGSDAKVNLWGFQPSEVSKYLIVIFIATFFAANTDKMKFFGERLTGWSWRRYAATVITILVAILLLAGIYVGVLSDMGPALVILITFIVLYSFARRDTRQLVIGFITFVAVLLLTAWLIPGSTLALVGAAALWFAAWIAIPWLRKRQVYESAVFLNVLILLFLVGGQILDTMGMHQGQRLLNRTAMVWDGAWNNEALGGDQVAQGMWSLATGGFLGQGPGNGHPDTVPAGSTDMVFTGIGEIGGWVSMVVVLLCFFVLVHRGLLAGRRSFTRFGFFLGSAIALVLGIQFVIIVAGSLGLIPLTGVAVPLLSFGQSSLIINLAFLGLLVSLSRDNQLEVAAANPAALPLLRRYDSMIAMVALCFLAAVAVIAGFLLKWQTADRDDILLRPAVVANEAGARVVAYNPRIGIAMDAIGAGNITDRNGLVLASDRKRDIKSNSKQLLATGIDRKQLAEALKGNNRRYYPLGAHTLLMLGDANTRDVWTYSDNAPVGYVAENRHLAYLRGFDNIKRDAAGHPVMLHALASDYHPSRFLPGTDDATRFVQRDYSPLLEVLKQGVSPDAVEQWIDEHPNRDLRLTLDAGLQVRLYNALDQYIDANPVLARNPVLRASAVVIDPKNGDLLASANWPMPSADTIAAVNARGEYNTRAYERQKGRRAYTVTDLGLSEATPPGSVAKVMTAMAAFNQLGSSAASYVHRIPSPIEAIEGRNEPGVDGSLIDMRRSLVASSNNYYINMLHDHNLYPGLRKVYEAAGIGIHGRGGNAVPYGLEPGDLGNDERYGQLFDRAAADGMDMWRTYKRQRAKGRYHKLNYNELGMAWGQGSTVATPLAMARIAGTVANGGIMAPTRYYIDKNAAKAEPVRLLSSSQAATLRGHMNAQYSRRYPEGATSVGGKTGTPERYIANYTDAAGHHNVNDAWYICYAYSPRLRRNVAIAVRFERAGVNSNTNSSTAMQFVNSAVLPLF